MKWERFQTRVAGKWVLTGEHAVLRGATAVALPHPEIGLSLFYEPEGGESPLSIQPANASPLMKELISAVAENCESQGQSFPQPQGQLQIQSTIPIGAGLGSSAALCVALSRWMAEPLKMSEESLPEFATQLEHRFHGRSSGMDVAVIASGEPISFQMGRGSCSLGVKKLPRFTFHDTGLRSRTSECVLKVETFRRDHPSEALQIDEAMSTASRWAMEGLVLYDAGSRKAGLTLIQSAIHQARECFYSWDLVPNPAKELEEELLRQGALGVKLTGAGGGGMIVALWE